MVKSHVVALALALPATAYHVLPLHRDAPLLGARRSLRQLADGSFQVVPLRHDAGTHYTYAYLGSPPQRTPVVVDTGSHVLAVPCAGGASFEVTSSTTLTYPNCTSAASTFQCASCDADATCHISQAYSTGGSWTGVVVNDVVALGDGNASSPYSTRFSFGCQTEVTGSFPATTGVLGVADSATSLVRQLYADKKIDQNVFSLCLTATGGTLAIGTPVTTADDDRRRLGVLQFARMAPNTNGWYELTIRAIRIGGKPLDLSPRVHQSVLLDSGSPTSSLPSALRDEFDRSFKNAGLKAYKSLDGGDDTTGGYARGQLSKMPTIEYVFEGMEGEDVVLTIPPARYLCQGETGRFTASIALHDEAPMGVIGADLLTNHDFVFDPDHHRVGFVPATCEYGAAQHANASGNGSVLDATSSSWEAAMIAEVGADVLVDTDDDADDAPMVDSVVGVGLALLFLGAVVYAVVRPAKPASSEWASLGVMDDDENDDETNELMVPSSPRAAVVAYDAHPDVHDAFFDATHDADADDHDALDRL
ncbi:hypothetical protein SPRG_13377 [Saprolegnia parasitica CBS 223.65]|uniref:Peptidase A1 domain-containing protein n=1 Tax=Saprolegnia parasitica (strain CBS 223.65) TaxID=695850 RepID=A0A067C4U1_SAPPC|nr:hypothetical protein SPRG_13377 [Saprolegnia parasitica CBS 223.65]KDO21566.1 hypothetical protein SPRG_13377 [Saprolegnia parasitica CBS 223.65]|eukprot:XP_012207743.1 hypothetical protein SPRG_13377 [Saprolegnia parasitica CBS 223.65]